MALSISWILIFVRRFGRCLKFYQKGLGLRLVRVYKGKAHPRWAEFQAGKVRLALHAGYNGQDHRAGRPVIIKFRVKNLHSTAHRITQYGGQIKKQIRRIDFRPAERELVYQAVFSDPDGNEFELEQLIKQFRK